MTNCITIIDYGVGNLHSVRRSVEVSGGEDIRVSGQIQDLIEADKIILPGVGTFEEGMKGLHERGLIAPLIEAAHSGIPILGICLGMQLLASNSEEFGLHEGLTLIPGSVKAIPKNGLNNEQIKVPFIGWSPLILSKEQSNENNCLSSANGKAVYLVHSFQLIPQNPAHLLAYYELAGQKITAAVRHKNIIGMQFHPEKSGCVGLSIMKTFINE